MERGFAVIGLGYVGLPVALALAKKFEPVVGFDISQQRIAALRNAKDTTGEVTEAALRETRLRFTDDPCTLDEASFFIVTVPTPIDAERRPDLSPLEVAEAAKVIENTQRDLNIALMNELAIIFDRLGIPTKEVLEAAGTKWNFLPFTPGLVGGHCIGVDPYYLTARAEAAGYYPQVILSGRRINDGMGGFIAQRLVKLLIAAERPVKGAKIGILGITFKENVPDLRNSRVPDIVAELRDFGIAALVSDPLADPAEAKREYGVELVALDRFTELDGLILAVPHRVLAERGWGKLFATLAPGGIFVDVKSAVARSEVPQGT